MDATKDQRHGELLWEHGIRQFDLADSVLAVRQHVISDAAIRQRQQGAVQAAGYRWQGLRHHAGSEHPPADRAWLNILSPDGEYSVQSPAACRYGARQPGRWRHLEDGDILRPRSQRTSAGG